MSKSNLDVSIGIDFPKWPEPRIYLVAKNRRAASSFLEKNALYKSDVRFVNTSGALDGIGDCVVILLDGWKRRPDVEEIERSLDFVKGHNVVRVETEQDNDFSTMSNLLRVLLLISQRKLSRYVQQYTELMLKEK